ncbi:sulfatase-like hydrolase/transferase [Luminiphilus sp.]|nr:sulfatase-like hydrolase/transferase [Luminiphilus sp.]
MVDIGLSSNPAIEISSGTTKLRPSAAMVTPAAISSLLANMAEGGDELGKRGLTDNTIFVFSSEHGSDLPFGKWTAYDAGVKVALVVRWPNKISPGISSAIVESVDLLPTLMELSLNTVPKGLDGRSFSSLLSGATDTRK